MKRKERKIGRRETKRGREPGKERKIREHRAKQGNFKEKISL